MSSIWTLAQRTRRICSAVLVALVVVSGCSDTTPASTGSAVDARVVTLQNSIKESAAPRYMPPVISDRPIDPLVAGGWAAADSDVHFGYDAPRDPTSVQSIAAEAESQYVAWQGPTGCFGATDASLARDGDNLVVTFEVKDDDDIDCAVQNHAYVQFAVTPTAVRGVTTINGTAITDGSSPGVIVASIDLGSDAWQHSSYAPFPIETTEDSTEMTRALSDVDIQEPGAVSALLDERPDEGYRRFAFVLNGCLSATPIVMVTPGHITAELQTCSTNTFQLTVFDIPSDRVPQKAPPMLHGRE